jgi:hypothetical protein
LGTGLGGQFEVEVIRENGQHLPALFSARHMPSSVRALRDEGAS